MTMQKYNNYSIWQKKIQKFPPSSPVIVATLHSKKTTGTIVSAGHNSTFYTLLIFFSGDSLLSMILDILQL